MVHTKTNYARYGQSVRYRIVDGGVQWEGFSDITRQTLESAARHRTTPWEVMQKSEERESVNSALVEALEKSANQITATRFSYDEFKKDHGDLIFGGMQPKRALDAVKDRLADDGYYLKTGMGPPYIAKSVVSLLTKSKRAAEAAPLWRSVDLSNTF